MRKILLFALAFATSMAYADVNNEPETIDNEFGNEETIETGILNEIITNAIAPELAAPAGEPVEYGAKVTKYASTPKFGGYFIGKYANSDNDAANKGFSQRLIRLYVDGTLLNDFAYRIQLQVNNSTPHTKDFYLEWQKYKEFKVKIGQFKRAFTFENPMNPWDVGVGDYSQLVQKIAGMGDYCGEANMGGRDQGLQIQGDLFPAADGHRYVHYQAMIANGQGINTADANNKKDILGTIQVQPIKGLFVGVFGWKGNYTSGGVTVDRNRYVVSAKYDVNDWTFRTEYGHSNGHKISDWDKVNNTWNGYGECDAWYATVGVPCTPWLKTYVKWDVFRDGAISDNTKSIYSLCPNFKLHKNLQFQLQFNYVNDKMTDNNYSEFWLETYVRF